MKASQAKYEREKQSLIEKMKQLEIKKTNGDKQMTPGQEYKIKAEATGKFQGDYEWIMAYAPNCSIKILLIYFLFAILSFFLFITWCLHYGHRF